MKAIKLFVLVTVVLCAIFSFSSCSRLMGYSVVLWSVPEQNLTDGMIVPVYIKSNITHTYVIGIPETDQKCEVPLWQISEPTSKKDVKELSEKYAEYQQLDRNVFAGSGGHIWFSGLVCRLAGQLRPRRSNRKQ